MDGMYDIIEIGKDAWQIEEENVRSFLFVGKEKALLIDSGLTIRNIRKVVEGVTDLPIMLVNTHTDNDHISCNEHFDEVWMHPSEYASYHKGRKRIEGIKPLWDGDIIDLGSRRFKVVLTPGHTPGSITFLDSDNRILVGGDGVQVGTIFLFGQDRDLLAYLHSLERLQSLSDRFDFVYPSHSQCPVPSTIIQDLIRGVKRILNGELNGESSYYGDIPIRIYDLGVAKILYELENPFV